jgi:hypothetical protein
MMGRSTSSESIKWGEYLEVHLPLELLDNAGTDCAGSFGRLPALVVEATPLSSDTKLVVCGGEAMRKVNRER